jgi:phosphatidate cytidylyltransferase
MSLLSLRKRVPTALFLLLLVFLVIQFSRHLIFFLFAQVVILASLFEFYNLFRLKKLFPQKTLGILLALIISASFYFTKFPLELALFLCLLIAGLYYVISFNTLEKLVTFPSSVSLTVFGPLYLSFTLNFFYPLREDWRSPFYIYFLFAVIFLGDTGAYFFGKLWGRRKMVPMASPRKTWEGSFGGILFAVLGALLAQQVLLRSIPLWKALVSGILIHAVAQLSDPLESLFKRGVGVKDSSNVLPGHGGVLDRIDSLILGAPFFYYLIKFFWS